MIKRLPDISMYTEEVVCTVLEKRGLYDPSDRLMDIRYSFDLIEKSRVTYDGYYCWATHLAQLMLRYPIVLRLMNKFTKRIVDSVCGRKNFLGDFALKYGLKACWLIGTIRYKLGYKVGCK